ncbi:MAG TPA: putative porin [Rhizomicrobium sp.]|jgi:hypothetical protein
MSVGFNVRRALCLSVSLVALGMAAPPAFAQASAVPPNATETAMYNLVQSLVKKGVVTRKDGQAMLDKFHTDLRSAPAPQPVAAATPAPVAAPAPAELPAGTVRIPYVSAAVRQQIKDEVRDEVIATAKRENWAAPNSYPTWIGHLTLFGDVRVRNESRFFDKNNELTFVNVGAINNGAPYNTGQNTTTLPPILNSTKDRNLSNFRARFGLTDQIDQDLVATIRLASGSDNQPVSTNQTMGNYFNKDGVWLDQAFIKYTPDLGFAHASFTAGRMPNPFVKTDLVWDEDVNLDGIAVSLDHTFLDNGPGEGLNLRFTGGAFPLSYGADDFPSNATSDQKAGSGANKYVFAGQLGADWMHDRYDLSFNAAYYDYSNVQGTPSPSCSNQAAYCLTDYSRPGYMQKGNTLFALRNLTFPDPSDVTAPQYFGLASKYEVLDLVAKGDMRLTGDIHLSLTGDYAKNLGYNAGAIQALPIINNNETCSVQVPANSTCGGAGGTNLYKSGDTAWLTRIQIGHPIIAHRWDWSAFVQYEYIEPDSVLDAFNDQDFHLGGTNAKGFVIGGSLGVAHNTALNVKWFSTDAISGPPFSEDTLQVDLSTRF